MAKNDVDSYFKLWKQVESIQGPFSKETQKQDGITKLTNIKHFHVSMYKVMA